MQSGNQHIKHGWWQHHRTERGRTLDGSRQVKFLHDGCVDKQRHETFPRSTHGLLAVRAPRQRHTASTATAVHAAHPRHGHDTTTTHTHTGAEESVSTAHTASTVACVPATHPSGDTTAGPGGDTLGCPLALDGVVVMPETAPAPIPAPAAGTCRVGNVGGVDSAGTCIAVDTAARMPPVAGTACACGPILKPPPSDSERSCILASRGTTGAATGTAGTEWWWPWRGVPVSGTNTPDDAELTDATNSAGDGAATTGEDTGAVGAWVYCTATPLTPANAGLAGQPGL